MLKLEYNRKIEHITLCLKYISSLTLFHYHMIPKIITEISIILC